MKKYDPELVDSPFLSKFVSMKYLPRWTVLFLDVFLCVIAFLIAIYIADKLSIDPVVLIEFNDFQRISILMVFQIILFWSFHTYSGVLRYSSFVDAIKIFFSVTINVLIITLINLVLTSLSNGVFVSYAELIVYGILSFLFMFLVRLLGKTSYDYLTQRGEYITPVMIYGTKSAAIGIAKMLMSEQVGSKYKLVGFIDDDKNASEKMIMGVKVYHLNDEILKKVIMKKCKSIIKIGRAHV